MSKSVNLTMTIYSRIIFPLIHHTARRGRSYIFQNNKSRGVIGDNNNKSGWFGEPRAFLVLCHPGVPGVAHMFPVHHFTPRESLPKKGTISKKALLFIISSFFFLVATDISPDLF